WPPTPLELSASRSVYAKPNCDTLEAMDAGSIAMTGPAGGAPTHRRRAPELSSVKTLPQAAALFFHHGSPRLLALHLLALLALRLAHGGFGVGDLLVGLGVAI